jgi:hypothetical protein
MVAAILPGLRLGMVCGFLAIPFFTPGIPSSRGCAAAWRKGAPPVYIAEESAIIVWDEATRTQHFIRKAAFQSKVAKGDKAHFGFLVPTPSIPVLAEVGQEAFATIAQIMTPPRKETSKLDFSPVMCFFVGTKSARDAAPGNVQVLHEQQVAGYDAAVLDASDGKSLNKWLGENGYVSRPALDGWLDHYVKLKWKITAFKIAEKTAPKSAADELFRPLATGAVRMSFRTDRPFFPYREPEEDAEKARESGGRLMQVFFLGRGRMSGRLGEKAGAPWDARITWTDQLHESFLARLATELDLPAKLPAGTWMTTFQDRSTHRPQHDLFFEPAAEQTPILPPPIVVVTRRIHLPPDLIGLGLLMVFLVWVVFRRMNFRGIRK